MKIENFIRKSKDRHKTFLATIIILINIISIVPNVTGGGGGGGGGTSGNWYPGNGGISLSVGQTSTINLGSLKQVNTVHIQVGCNDGETMNGYVEYLDGNNWITASSFTGAGCGYDISLSIITDNLRLTMTSGGGNDSKISWYSEGSSGWKVYATDIVTTGTLSVTTTPINGNILVDGVSKGTGSWSGSMNTGSHTVSFGDYSDYTTPSSQTATVNTGQTTTVTGTYVPIQPGILSVTTTPINGNIIVDGVSKGTGSWSGSMNIGSHTISFGAVSGYTTPSQQTVTVNAGQTTTVTGTYVLIPTTGTISVTTTPINGNILVDGVSKGIGSWTGSVDTGSHTVSFGAVSGYTTPSSQTVTINSGQMTTVTGSYIPIPIMGTLSVTTNNVVATFTITGPATYTGSGTSWSQSNAPTGTYSIAFGAISGYTTPTDTNKVLTSGGTASFTGTYVPTQTTGTLSVTTNPVNGNILVDGVSKGIGSWTGSVDTGSHTVSFGIVSGYTTPSPQTFTIIVGETKTVTGMYVSIPPMTSTPIVPMYTPAISTPVIPITVVAPTAIVQTPVATRVVRIGPTVQLRPVNDDISISEDGAIELYIDNPSINEEIMHADVTISVPSGIGVYGQGFGNAGSAGVLRGVFDISPGKATTIQMTIKAERTGDFLVKFSGLYWLGNNKNDYQPISLTHNFKVHEIPEEKFDIIKWFNDLLKKLFG